MSVQRPAPPWKDWTRAEWQAHRDLAAAHLAAHPDWIVGAAVVAQADHHLARLAVAR